MNCLDCGAKLHQTTKYQVRCGPCRLGRAMKVCSKCLVDLPFSEFHAARRKRDLDGRRSVCRECDAAPARERKLADPVRKQTVARARYARITYGMTLEEFDGLKEGGECAICGGTDRLRIDHDHDLNEVRGVLCHSCNVGLGLFKDNPLVVLKAAEYLVAKLGMSQVTGISVGLVDRLAQARLISGT